MDTSNLSSMAGAYQRQRDEVPVISVTDSVDFNFDLADLGDELHIVNRSNLPFRRLSQREVQREYGISLSLRPSTAELCGFVRAGNYAKGYVLSKLRKERKSNYCFSDLSMVFDLPTELIQEIFEHLHPIDLYNLINTSRSIRNMLLSRRSSCIWSAAFYRYPDIPPPPRDLSYPYWTSLLWAPAICDACGERPAMVDFTFRQRICTECMATHYRSSSTFEYLRDELGSELDTIWSLSLVAGSYRTNSMIYPSENEYNDLLRRYRKHDVDVVAAKMKPLLAAIKAGLPMAVKNYENFKSEQIVSVTELMQNIRRSNDWILRIHSRLYVAYLVTTIPNLVNKKLKKYLVKQGHDPQDIRSITDRTVRLFRNNPIHKTSKQIFRSFLPEILNYLDQVKTDRRSREHCNRLLSRQKRIATLYRKVREKMDPITWSTHPEPEDIYRIPSLSRYICDEDEASTISDEDVKTAILLYISEGELYARRQLSDALSKTESVSLNPCTEILDLASAVFTCPVHTSIYASHQSWSALIGWNDAADHINCVVPGRMSKSRNIFGDDARRPGFKFCVKSFELLKGLLDVLGLDINTTLSSDIDSLPARFVCTTCPLTSIKGGGKGTYALNVKECLAHALKNPTHNLESFRLLSDDFTKPVLAREKQLPGTASWCCRHCTEHLLCANLRKDVLFHLRMKHSIHHPILKIDIFQQLPVDRKDHKDCFIILEPPQNYLCCACHGDAKNKMWNSRALMSHLSGSHAIKTFRADVDWIQVALHAT